MIISVGNSRKATNWIDEETTFEEMAVRCSIPIISEETFAEYLNLPKPEQDELKDVGGFVGGQLKDKRRKKNNVLNRSLVTLDADNISGPVALEEIIGKLAATGWQYIVYSTRKHTEENPRIRIIIPLEIPIPPEMYEPCVRKICEYLGIEQFDPTTVEGHRLMYWPSVSKDMVDAFYYRFSGKDKKPLFIGDILNQYKNWNDTNEWPQFLNDEIKENRGSVQQDPLEKGGAIGAFCKSFSVTEAIDAFLPEVYQYCDKDRYTYIEGSTSGGLLIFDNDRFAYSYHSTDPANCMLCNAFDLVRIHKFGKDEKSTSKMIEFASNLPQVQELIQKEAIEELAETVTVYEEEQKAKEEEAIEFSKSLQRDKKGNVLKTIDNIYTILTGDPNLKGRYYYDLFGEYMMIKEALPWQQEREVPRLWNDTDDAGLRRYLEKNYGITGKEKILDATALAFSDNSMHPIKEYLEGLKWDGKPRLDSLLIDYYGAEDNVYTRQATRKALIAAVTRIYEPGAKFDYMVILIGSQGIGKSTFFSKLGMDWFSDSLNEFSGKDAFELLQNSWIIEVGELSGFNKYEVNQIKHFLTKQKDEYRAAYARRKEAHLRQCVIFGTTNESTFLRDTTGNRRFWPIPLEEGYPSKSIFEDFDDEVDQIWAEAYAGYKAGEFLDLEGDKAKQLAEIQQKLRTEIDPREAQIIEFLKQPLPKDWYKQSIETHNMYWANPNTDNSEKVRRDRVCAHEIHLELFNRTLSEFDRYKAKEINSILDSIPGLKKMKTGRFGDYGLIKGPFKVTEEFYELN